MWLTKEYTQNVFFTFYFTCAGEDDMYTFLLQQNMGLQMKAQDAQYGKAEKNQGFFVLFLII